MEHNIDAQMKSIITSTKLDEKAVGTYVSPSMDTVMRVETNAKPFSKETLKTHSYIEGDFLKKEESKNDNLVLSKNVMSTTT